MLEKGGSILSMNVLDRATQSAVLRALVEGNSLRSTARMTGVARNTIAKLLQDVGAHCKNHHDRFVTGVASTRVELDELWAFCERKEKNVAPENKGKGTGDIWTWTAIDPDSKLILAYRIGGRTAAMAHAFVHDLADRLTQRVQITTDALQAYLSAIESAFGWDGADYARLMKIFGATTVGVGKYSPAKLVRTEKHWVMGRPVIADVSTSIVERNNLTIRMASRRYTRLTNGFSKKAEYHLYATALHFTYYNYVRTHTTLSKAAGKPTTPAMASGLADKPWTFDDILDLLHGE